MTAVRKATLFAVVAFCFITRSGLLTAQAQLLNSPPAMKVSVAELPDAPMARAAIGAAAAQAAAADPSGQAAPAANGSGPDAAPAASEDAKQRQHDEAERELKLQEKQRLLGVMPQFQVVMGGTAVPLTGGEKWRLALHTAIDPFYIGWAFVIGGGYGELVGSDNGYDWGPGGYFKRVGANYADNVNGALIGNALLPQLLHQDPRYFRKGTGSIKSRFLYAALSTVICHGDNGKRQPNVSNVLGNYLSGAISNAYYPADERGVKLTLENGTSVTVFGALGARCWSLGRIWRGYCIGKRTRFLGCRLVRAVILRAALGWRRRAGVSASD